MVDAVTLREIERIFEVTDRMGIHRERLVIPLAARHPGRVRLVPGERLEIVVESEGPFDAWLLGLEEEIRRVGGEDLSALNPGARPGPGGTPPGRIR
jgi:hypothetical protein